MMAQINKFQDPEYHQNVIYQIEREKELKSKLEQEAKQLEKQVLHSFIFPSYHVLKNHVLRLINSEKSAWCCCESVWLR